MNFDISKSIDSVQDGTKEVAELVHKKTSEFHSHFLSKTIPNTGKFGNVAKFAAELVPGVAEYNAIREGDWKGFVIAAGVDVAAIGAGIFTAGAGAAAIKGGSVAAKAGVKVATREIAEAGAKKVVKETAEAGAKKIVKETAETGVRKAVKETTETGSEKAVKEVAKKSEKKTSKEVNELSNLKNHTDDKGVVFREKEHLLPSKKYEINGYKYETDETGRIVSAEGKLKLRDDEYIRSMEDVKRFEGQEYRASDDRGHLIAHRFGGSDKLENIVPMNENLNKGEFKALENKLADAVEAKADVRLRVEPKYEKGSTRPTEFKVSYSIDGDRATTFFRNERME